MSYMKEVVQMRLAEEVIGFDGLSEVEAKKFKAFLNNFYNAQGTEARKTVNPLRVKLVKGRKPYVRFDYQIYGRIEWLHVVDPSTWY